MSLSPGIYLEPEKPKVSTCLRAAMAQDDIWPRYRNEHWVQMLFSLEWLVWLKMWTTHCVALMSWLLIQLGSRAQRWETQESWCHLKVFLWVTEHRFLHLVLCATSHSRSSTGRTVVGIKLSGWTNSNYQTPLSLGFFKYKMGSMISTSKSYCRIT